jgi:hypothetical protein
MKKQAMSKTNSIEYGGKMCMNEITITRQTICSKPSFCVHDKDGTVLAEFVEADPGWVCKCDRFGLTSQFIRVPQYGNIELAILMEIRRGQLNENKLLTILEKCSIWLYLQSNPENVGNDFFYILCNLPNGQKMKDLWENAHQAKKMQDLWENAHQAIWKEHKSLGTLEPIHKPNKTVEPIHKPNKTIDYCPWCDSDLDGRTSCLCGFGD